MSPSHSNSSIAFVHGAGSVDTRYLTPIGGTRGRSDERPWERIEENITEFRNCS